MNREKMMFFVKGIFFVSIVLVVALGIQYAIDNYFDNVNELSILDTEQKVEIIYFGDSILEAYAKTDIDKRGIVSFLKEYSGSDILMISNDAYHPGVFEAYSEYICSKENRPNIVIVPVNMRSFSPEWDPRPNYQFNDKIEKLSNPDGTIIERIFKRIKDLSGDENPDEKKDWKNTTVYYFDVPRGQINDYLFNKDPDTFEDIESKYIFHYMYKLDKDHRRVVSLKNMVDNYKKCNVTAIIYITPIDNQLGKYYVGRSFEGIVSYNIDVISDTLNETDIIDMSFALNSSDFDHPNSPNEHLKTSGRMYVAKRLNETLYQMEKK